MSFALIRVIVNHRYGARCVIPTTDIENYCPTKHETNIKYFMEVQGKRYLGIIHKTDDDPEALKKELMKRLSTPTLHKCKTNLSNPAPTAEKIPKRNSECLDGQNQTKKKPKIISDQSVKGKDLIDVSKIKQEFVEKKRAGKKQNQQKPTESKENHVAGAESFNFLTSPPSQISIQDTASSARGDLSTVQAQKNPKSTMKSAVSPLAERQPKKNVNTHQKVDVVCHREDTKKPRQIANQLEDFKKKLIEKNREILKLSKLVDDLKKIINDKEAIIDDLLKLNIDLQKKAINNFDQLHELFRGMKQANPNTSSADGSHLAVGYLDSKSLQVHIGRNQWIPQREWTYVVSLLEPASFVHELARRMIGEDNLKKMTLTGRGSNRSGTGNQKTWEQCDPVKVEAIRDALRWYLSSYKFQAMPAATKTNHILSVKSYIQSFISDLKKKNKTSNKAKATTQPATNSKRQRGSKGKKKREVPKKEEEKDTSESDDERDQDREGDMENLGDNEETEVSEDELLDKSRPAGSAECDLNLSKAREKIMSDLGNEEKNGASEDEIEKELRESEDFVAKTEKEIFQSQHNESASSIEDYRSERKLVSENAKKEESTMEEIESEGKDREEPKHVDVYNEKEEDENFGNLSNLEGHVSTSLDRNDTVLIDRDGDLDLDGEGTPVTSDDENES